MAYTALYRKWRPNVFDDVKGQDHVVTTLKNQIIVPVISLVVDIIPSGIL